MPRQTQKTKAQAQAKAQAKANPPVAPESPGAPGAPAAPLAPLAEEVRPLAQMFVAGFRASDLGLDAQEILAAFIGAIDKHHPKLGESHDMPREASIQFIGSWKEFVDGSLL